MKDGIAETPLMKQYFDIKSKHPDAILLFRCGDFYETFSKDAIRASEVLGITLTRRANGAAKSVELAGFPHHALDTYLPKLVRAGMRVAICDQLEDPKLTKKLVKRGVTELVTPGVSYSDTTLNHKENNFLASVYFDKKKVGVAFLDISTGEFLVAEGNVEYVDKLLNSFSPKEVLYDRNKKRDFEESFGNKFFIYGLEDWAYTPDSAHERLLKQFETRNLKGFGVENLPFAVVAAGAILHYLDLTHHQHTGHITQLSRIEEDRYVWLDRFTVRNLELYGSMHEGAKTLVQVLDKTISPMGARLLKRWIAFPLKDVKPINERLGVVEYLFKHPELKELLEQNIALIGDLERIISKVAVGRINPREVVQLKVALRAIEPIKQTCADADNSALNKIADQLNACQVIADKIEKEIQPDLLVWATGAVQHIPKIKGLETQHVITCIDYFRGENKVKGPRVLVIGVGQVGVEITEKLGKEGYDVVAVEIVDQLGGAMEAITKKLALMRIEQLEKVTLMPQTAVKEFKSDCVEVEKDGEILSLEPFQSVILASGMLSAPEPDDAIKKRIANIEIIGDAHNVKDTFTAVRAGYELACKY